VTSGPGGSDDDAEPAPRPRRHNLITRQPPAGDRHAPRQPGRDYSSRRAPRRRRAAPAPSGGRAGRCRAGHSRQGQSRQGQEEGAESRGRRKGHCRQGQSRQGQEEGAESRGRRQGHCRQGQSRQRQSRQVHSRPQAVPTAPRCSGFVTDGRWRAPTRQRRGEGAPTLTQVRLSRLKHSLLHLQA